MPGFQKDKMLRGTSERRVKSAGTSKILVQFLCWAIFAWAISGCAILTKVVPRPLATQTLVTPQTPTASWLGEVPSTTPSASPPLQNTPSPMATALSGRPITLTVWLPPQMVPDLAQDIEVSAFVASAHAAFLAAQRNARLSVAPKALYGTGGMLDLLLAMQPVAPWRLPDIALVDASELPALVEHDLAMPLNDLIPAAIWDDLFPFALEAVSTDEGLYGVPFQVDLPLLVYNLEAVTDPPQRWEQLLAGSAKIVFPAAQGEDGAAADLFMVQYLARGGKVAAPPFALDAVIAARVLRDYRNAFDRGILVSESREAQTWERSWAFYLAGTADMTLAGSWQYLRDRALLVQSHYSAVPTVSMGQFTLARSLVWVVFSQDPERRQLAAQYVRMMVDTERLNEWSTISHHLSARRSSYSIGFEADLRAFLESLLAHASPYPLSPVYLKARGEIARAIEDVLDGVTTPERAASSLAITISRLR